MVHRSREGKRKESDKEIEDGGKCTGGYAFGAQESLASKGKEQKRGRGGGETGSGGARVLCLGRKNRTGRERK